MATPTQTVMAPPPRRRSIFGPVVLIGFGILMLMVTMGKLDARRAAYLFAQYWPLIFIFWGLVKLYEHMDAKRQGHPAPGIGAGGIVLLVFLLLFGSAASGVYRASRNVNWSNLRDQIDLPDDDFGQFLGTKYEYSSNIDQAFPANATLKVVGDRGAIKVSPSSDGKLHVVAHRAIYADSQDAANRINSSLSIPVNTVDNILTVDASHRGGDSSSLNSGSVTLEILAPQKAPLDLYLLRGDINVSARQANIKADSSRGNLNFDGVTGNVFVVSRGGSNLTARNVTGDVTLDGRAQDVKVSDISGVLTLESEIFGEIDLSKLGKGLRFKSNRTDMELARLDGELRMGGGDLRADSVAGPLRISTRSKDIHLEDVSGDVKVDNTNGEVEISQKLPVGNMDIRDKRGEIRLTLPSNGSFQLEASAAHGQFYSDFNTTSENKNGEARATATVNKGGARILLSNEHGNITIRKQ
jgi:DUF4097 and DUF4098 domain-containing protein YvlB